MGHCQMTKMHQFHANYHRLGQLVKEELKRDYVKQRLGQLVKEELKRDYVKQRQKFS